MVCRNSILLLLCMALPCIAQTRTDDDVVRITTNLVQVDVVVTKKGKPIKDLKAEDFEIRARVKTAGYEVRTRSGFFGMSEEEAKRLKETADK